MATTGALSRAARERLEQELTQLREQRSALAPRLSEESLGDSADQADMLERAETAAWMDRRIHEIDEILRGGGTPRDENGLRPGTKVKLRFDDGSVDTLRVIGIAEEAGDDVDATITADSPLGQAITGHRKGDTISYRTPRGDASATIEQLTVPRQRRG